MNIQVNNITINYTKQGEGSPLIMLHGNGEDLHIFDKLTKKLKQHFAVYAMDSRNHGDSTKTDNYAYESMAEDVYQFIQKLNIKNPSIVGFSDGAIIAVLMAMQHQNLFDKMVLLGINLKPTDFKEENYNWMVEEYQKTNDPFLKMMLDEPNIELESLSSIQIPTLVVAAQDDLFRPESFENIVKTMPNAALKIVKDHDHGSYVANEDVLYLDLVQFLIRAI